MIYYFKMSHLYSLFCGLVSGFLLVLSGTETSFPLEEIKKKKDISFLSEGGGTEYVLLDTSFMKYSFFPPSFFRAIKNGERTETPLPDGEYSP